MIREDGAFIPLARTGGTYKNEVAVKTSSAKKPTMAFPVDAEDAEMSAPAAPRREAGLGNGQAVLPGDGGVTTARPVRGVQPPASREEIERHMLTHLPHQA